MDVVVTYLALQAALRGAAVVDAHEEAPARAELLAVLAAPGASRDLCLGAMQVCALRVATWVVLRGDQPCLSFKSA